MRVPPVTCKMACCFSPHDQPEKNNDYILDVEKILNDYIWTQFKTSRKSWQRLCLRRKDFIVEVPMNYFHFDKIREEVRPRNPGTPQHPSTQQQDTTTQTQVQRPDAGQVMALSTDFTNSTDCDQTYSFKFEKTRKASVSVSVQKGFSVGSKVNFSVGLPSSGKVGGEMDMRVSFSKATGEVIEETVTWTATSEIKVKDNSSYAARVLLAEVPVSYNFKVWTKMSMPSGGAPGTVRLKKGGDWSYLYVIGDLKSVFEEYENMVEFRPEPLGDKFVTYSVVFKTRGIVEGVRLSGQKILLDGNPIQTRSSQGQPPQESRQGSVQNNHLVSEDGDLGSTAEVHHGGGGMLALPRPPPSSQPIITEIPEDNGVRVVGRSNHPSSLPAAHEQG